MKIGATPVTSATSASLAPIHVSDLALPQWRAFLDDPHHRTVVLIDVAEQQVIRHAANSTPAPTTHGIGTSAPTTNANTPSPRSPKPSTCPGKRSIAISGELHHRLPPISSNHPTPPTTAVPNTSFRCSPTRKQPIQPEHEQRHDYRQLLWGWWHEPERWAHPAQSRHPQRSAMTQPAETLAAYTS